MSSPASSVVDSGRTAIVHDTDQPASRLVSTDAVTTTADSALLHAIAQGDEQAFGQLYDRYAALVYRVALRITDDREQAERVVQEVFRTAWRDAARIGSDDDVGQWLLAWTRDLARAAKRGWPVRQPGAAGRQDGQAQAYDDVRDEAQAQQRAMHSAFSTLAPEQRTMIEMAYYDGLTCAQIAAATALPLATVRTSLRLGLMKLHERLRAARRAS